MVLLCLPINTTPSPAMNTRKNFTSNIIHKINRNTNNTTKMHVIAHVSGNITVLIKQYDKRHKWDAHDVITTSI